MKSKLVKKINKQSIRFIIMNFFPLFFFLQNIKVKIGRKSAKPAARRLLSGLEDSGPLQVNAI